MPQKSKKSDEMGYLQHKLTMLFRTSTTQLNERNKTLIWQNSNMKRLKLDEAELNFMLYLKQNYKVPPSVQFLKNDMVDVQKVERKLTQEVPKLEDLALLDSAINKRKKTIILEQRQLENSEELEKALKGQLYIMENSLEVKTLEFGRIRSELAKIRNEFYSLNQRLKIFEDMFYHLERNHDNLFSKMQAMSKSSVDVSHKITEADSKVVGMKKLIKLNEFHFNFELNEIDRQYMQIWNFDNFLADISRERHWNTLDYNLKKLEKALNTRYVQMKESQAAIAMIKRVGKQNDVDAIITEFRLTEEDIFSLFRFAVEIHCQLKENDSELQSLLGHFHEEEKSFLRQYSLLRNSLLSYQEKVSTEVEEAKTAQKGIDHATDQIALFHKELIELMQLLPCDSKMITDVENTNIKENFPKDAIIDIQERIIHIINIKSYLECLIVKQNHEHRKLYETHHHISLPPPLVTWD